MSKLIGRICNKLYRRLGITRSADIHEIKRAYREKAKILHPDLGGDTAMFSDLYEAYKVLSDPKARKRYDQTGEYRSSFVINEGHLRRKANEMIVFHFQKLCEKQGEEILFTDIFDQIKQSLRQERSEFKKQYKHMTKAKEVVSELLDRIEYSGNEFDILEGVILGRIQRGDETVDEINERFKIIQAAIELIDKNYKFNKKAKQEIVKFQTLYTTTGASGW